MRVKVTVIGIRFPNPLVDLLEGEIENYPINQKLAVFQRLYSKDFSILGR
jgi:hypothetical protein